MQKLDFAGLNQLLLASSSRFLMNLIPGGYIIGREYTCGSILGGTGKSFKCNLDTGKYADFADASIVGGDLISLYATVRGISQSDAFRELAEQYNFSSPEEKKPIIKSVNKQRPAPTPTPNNPFSNTDTDPVPVPKTEHEPITIEITAPPVDHKTPEMRTKIGLPSKYWSYTDELGNILFYVARYDFNGEKEFRPWTWNGHSWKPKGWPTPRPLYNLHTLSINQDKPVILCEGEKAADACQVIVGDRYVCMTWPNGSRAYKQANFDFLKNRPVLIWPDADNAGLSAASGIYPIIDKICQSVRVLDTSGRSDGWDAADALEEGWTIDNFEEFATPPKKPELIKHVEQGSDDDVKLDCANFALWEKLGLACTKGGIAINNMDNVSRVMEQLDIFKNGIWFDEFYNDIYTNFGSNGVPIGFREHICYEITIFLQRNISLTGIHDGDVKKALKVIAKRNTRNSAKDYFSSLKWDGIPRIETFLIEYAGSKDSDYSRAISRNFFISMVARVFKPGCQVDTMIILEGLQGKRKSTFLSTIAGQQWHTEAIESINHKDFFQCLSGKLIVEFADLSTWSNADVNKLKQIITNRKDTYRASYGEKADDYPRMGVFAGTTNDSVYLNDTTGGRRFWPIGTNNLDIPRTRDNREQLFAEAVSIFLSEQPANDDERVISRWWDVPNSAKQEQEDRRVVDPWEDDISRFIYGKNSILMYDLMEQCLKIDRSRKTRYDLIRIGRILTMFGFEKKRSSSGDREYFYERISAVNNPFSND